MVKKHDFRGDIADAIATACARIMTGFAILAGLACLGGLAWLAYDDSVTFLFVAGSLGVAHELGRAALNRIARGL